MKAILIDPFERIVREVETDGTLDSIYALMDCHYIEPVRPRDSHGDYLLLDENGKYRQDQKYFICRLWPYDALAGKAVWIGSDGAEFADARTNRDRIAAHIVWQVWE
jgi:hypothetical protein